MPQCGHDEVTLNQLKKWECANIEHTLVIEESE
jgi:hypothetical protein